MASKKSAPLDPPITPHNEAQKAFDLLKMMVMTTPVLAFEDYSKLFLPEMDALGLGLGAVLSQKQDDRKYHTVAFGSRVAEAGREEISLITAGIPGPEMGRDRAL